LKLITQLFYRLTVTREKRVLLENFFSLSFLQIANYLFPLFSFPYLVRVLGPEKFGLIAFATALMGYFNILVDYGFNLSATKDIAINKADKRKISIIFNSVMIIKLSLVVLSFIILSGLVIFVQIFRSERLLYIYSFVCVIGTALFPTWFFQGIEKMKYITVLSLLSKMIFTVLIFGFVKKPDDYLFVPLINSIGLLITGIWSIYIVNSSFNIKFLLPRYNDLFDQVKEGFYVFVSTMSISFYTTSNVFLLGLFTNNVITGYYAAAERIIRILQQMIVPVTQSVYPHINTLFLASKQSGLRFLKKLVLLIGLPLIIICSIVFCLSPFLVHLILGVKYQASIGVLRILSFIPFVVFISQAFGSQLLIPLGFKKIFSYSIVFPAIFHMSALIIYVPKFGAVGAAIIVLITEIVIATSRMLSIRIFHKEVWKGLLYAAE